ncbi:MAG: 3'-5' exonuclease, partial [Mariniblastus sp.]|nr:3'-5' exonuclease [Mariniblastus sp.]
GYRDWLTDDGSEEGFERASNVDELVVAAQEYDRDHPNGGGLEGYLEQAALVSDTDVWEAEADYVTLMTLHAAKGLEFPCVYIVGLEDGILPHERSSGDDDEIEEERRLLFVGITRAEEQLQISRCMNRFRRGSYWPVIASRFLMELPREEMQIFEPVSNQTFDDESLADSIADLDPWAQDELPSYDINEELAQGDTGGVPAPPPSNDAPSEVSTTPKPAIPRIVTAAQLQAEQEAMSSHVRLHPNAYQVDMHVEHPEYGAGVVIEITGKDAKRTATIEFENHGRKRFRLAFCNLRVH